MNDTLLSEKLNNLEQDLGSKISVAECYRKNTELTGNKFVDLYPLGKNYGTDFNNLYQQRVASASNALKEAKEIKNINLSSVLLDKAKQYYINDKYPNDITSRGIKEYHNLSEAQKLAVGKKLYKKEADALTKEAKHCKKDGNGYFVLMDCYSISPNSLSRYTQELSFGDMITTINNEQDNLINKFVNKTKPKMLTAREAVGVLRHRYFKLWIQIHQNDNFGLSFDGRAMYPDYIKKSDVNSARKAEVLVRKLSAYPKSHIPFNIIEKSKIYKKDFKAIKTV